VRDELEKKHKSIDIAHDNNVLYMYKPHKTLKRSVKIVTNITVRIDDDVKRDAETLFGKLGLSISGAINIFFRQAIREQAIPFRVRAVSEYEEYFNEHNMERLKESIAQAESGQVIVKTMAELEAME